MRVDEYFDSLYRGSDRYWWKDEDRYTTNPDAYPRSLLTQHTLRLLRGRRPGRALDLGAGEGADAIRLARLGYSVDAVDISQVAIEKIRRFAHEAEVSASIRTHVSDVEEFEPAGKYDVVICNGVLHYVEDKMSVAARMQDATCLEGLNVISLWSAHTPVPEYHNSVPTYCDEEDGVIVKIYGGWSKELLYFERDKSEASHSDLPPHRHSHIKLIARRVL